MSISLLLIALVMGLLIGSIVYRRLTRSELQPSYPSAPATPTVTITPGSYRVVIVSPGPRKIELIKAVRLLTGLGLAQAKNFADRPGMSIDKLSLESAQQVSAALQTAGAVVTIEDRDAAIAPQPSVTTVQSQRIALEIVDPGPSKIQAIRVIRQATGEGLFEAKASVEQGHLNLDNLDPGVAEKLKAALEAAGATVRIREITP